MRTFTIDIAYNDQLFDVTFTADYGYTALLSGNPDARVDADGVECTIDHDESSVIDGLTGKKITLTELLWSCLSHECRYFIEDSIHKYACTNEEY